MIENHTNPRFVETSKEVETHQKNFISASEIPTELPIFIGSWKVTRYIDGYYPKCDSHTLESSVEKLIGKCIYFGEDQIIIEGEVCKTQPKYITAIHPVKELAAYMADGWSFKEESREEFLGDNTTYFIFITTLPDENNFIYLSVNLFLKNQDTMIAHFNEGGVELKRVNSQHTEESVDEYSQSIYTADFGSLYLGEWELCNYIDKNKSNQCEELLGKYIILSDFYVRKNRGIIFE